MLTNNKKRSFVKLIALTLAALMVFSVCLTGCTDEDARQAAADAQATADAATTAEEVSAKITEALAPYLKSADLEAEVNKIVAAALKDCLTTEDLADYAKSAELKALTDKLSGYVTSGDVKGIVEKAMADYDISKAVNAAIEKKGYITAAEAQKLIDKALATYVTEDDLAATLAEYFGDAEPETVLAVLSTMAESEGAMDYDEWMEATDRVVAVLAAADTVLDRAANQVFTQANKAKINDLSGLTLFPVKDGTYGTYDEALADVTLAEIGIRILRAPSVAVLDEIGGGFEAAVAVPSLQDELTGIKNELYSLGKVVTVDTDRDGALDDGDKYAAAAKYHGKDYAKDANQVAQVVTYTDKTAFAAIQAKLDAIIVKYTTECVATDFVRGNITFDFTADDIYAQYTIKDGDKTETVWLKANAYKGNAYSPAENKGADPAASPKTWTFDGKYTVGIGTNAASAATTFAVGTAPADGKYMTGYFDASFREPAIKVDTLAYAPTGKLVAVLDSVNATNDVPVANTYAAIITMLADVDAAMATAEATFKAFLKQIATNNDGSLKTDAEYLAALKDYMCEETVNTQYFTVPAAWVNSAAGYLLDKVANDFNYAYNINGNTTANLYKYDLFEDMNDKAYDLLFDKYQLKALDVLNKMLNDYIVVTQTAADVDGDATAFVDAAANNTAAGKLNYTDAMWSDGFLNAFYTGAKFTWEIDGQKMGPEHSYKSYSQYYTNNNVAFVPTLTGTTIGNASVQSDVLAVIAANAKLIQIELAAATVGPRTAILGASLAEKKASGVAVNKAFDTELNTAKANLDEIIYRYTYEEIKEAILNDTYSYVAKNATGIYEGGLANYFNDKAGVNAAIEDILKKYVTGYNDTADSYGFTYNPVYNGATLAGYTVDKNGNGAVVDALDAIKVAATDKVVGTEIALVATQAVADAEAVSKAAVETMADLAVKYRFNDYLKTAKEDLYFTYASYAMAATDYAVTSELLKIYNTHLEQITIVEYMNNRGVIALDQYLETFQGVLADVIGSKSTYYGLTVTDQTKANYTEAKKAIKSANLSGDWLVADKVQVAPVQPEEVYTGADQYYTTGAAAIDFDREMNKNAALKNGTKLY